MRMRRRMIGIEKNVPSKRSSSVWLRPSKFHVREMTPLRYIDRSRIVIISAMDAAVNQLNVLLKQGVISVQTYADGLDAINLREAPTPAPRRRAPIPAPRARAPIPAPRRSLRGLVFEKTPWAIGNFLRGWQMDVPRGHRLGADPLVFLDGVRPQIHRKLTEEI